MSEKRPSSRHPNQEDVKRARMETPFKSPEITRRKPVELNEEQLRLEIQRLETELSNVDIEIARLRVGERCEASELNLIIDKLHLYNDVKDTAQFLLEKMANIKCVTIKKMHEIYDCDSDWKKKFVFSQIKLKYLIVVGFILLKFGNLTIS